MPQGIQPGVVAALAIGIAAWGGFVLDPVISPATALFDPALILLDLQSVASLQEGVASLATSNDSVSSVYSSCSDSVAEVVQQQFDPLKMPVDESTEHEKGIIAEIGQALEDKKYARALTLFAGALVLSILVGAAAKKSRLK